MENNIQKIKDIKSLINEFYHDMKCRGLLTDDARKCQLSYLKDCDDIEKELEKIGKGKGKVMENQNKSENKPQENLKEKVVPKTSEEYLLRRCIQLEEEVEVLRNAYMELHQKFNQASNIIRELTSKNESKQETSKETN